MTEPEKTELHTFEVHTTDTGEGKTVDFVQATTYELNVSGQLIFRNAEGRISRIYNSHHWKCVKDWHEDDDDG